MWNLNEHLGEGVAAWMTDDQQDFSLPEDGFPPFNNEKKNIMSQAGIDPDAVFHIRQVHGAAVLKVGQCLLNEPRAIPEADGAVTNAKDVVLAVRTADCIPVFFHDPVHQCIGLVHAGWKSIQQKIVSVALMMMAENFGTEPSDVRVVFGPSIHDCCYQVGQEFCEIFPEHMIPRMGDWFLDLPAINREQLIRRGVLPENIHDTEMCTCCNGHFFSFRRDGGRAGRHLSAFRMMGEGR